MSDASVRSSAFMSDSCLASNATSLPRHHHLFDFLCNFLDVPFLIGLLLHFYILLLLYITLSVSLWVGFSVDTGCGSAGSWRIVNDHLFFFLMDGVERSCCPLLALELKLKLLGKGWGLRIGRWS